MKKKQCDQTADETAVCHPVRDSEHHKVGMGEIICKECARRKVKASGTESCCPLREPQNEYASACRRRSHSACGILPRDSRLRETAKSCCPQFLFLHEPNKLLYALPKNARKTSFVTFTQSKKERFRLSFFHYKLLSIKTIAFCYITSVRITFSKNRFVTS